MVVAEHATETFPTDNWPDTDGDGDTCDEQCPNYNCGGPGMGSGTPRFVEFDRNLLFRTQVLTFVINFKTPGCVISLQQWQADLGLDVNSIQTDPLFVDPATDSCRLVGIALAHERPCALFLGSGQQCQDSHRL